jgi:ribosomal protein S12 methylthiotransferase
VSALSEFGIWIRLHYLYPYPHIDEVLPLMADRKIVPYLDVPFQHASNHVLKLMRRPANIENQLKRIESWRSICPDVTIRSTFIVGFPGETEEDFCELLDFIEDAKLDRVGCFMYSQVRGAEANNLPGYISHDVKLDRQDRLMNLQSYISETKLQSKIGKTIDVIIDEVNKKKGLCIGRSFGDSPEIDGIVNIKSDSKIINPGDIVKVIVTDSGIDDLSGILS